MQCGIALNDCTNCQNTCFSVLVFKKEPSLQTRGRQNIPIQTGNILRGALYKKHCFKNGTFSHQADTDYSFFEEEKDPTVSSMSLTADL